MRLAKYLAHGGVASRRTAERIVANGRVTVGGEVITDPARDVGEADDVRVDGSRVAAEPREVWAVNKPAGVVSTAKEPGRRPAVVELVASGARLYPVGRLDVDSIGLLLLTNDGELANRLTHPRNEVAKAYRVELRRPPSDADLEQLRRGVELEDGPTGGRRCAASASAGWRSSCAKGATARCGAWQKRLATEWWSCVASVSVRSSWDRCRPERLVASARTRSPASGRM